MVGTKSPGRRSILRIPPVQCLQQPSTENNPFQQHCVSSPPLEQDSPQGFLAAFLRRSRAFLEHRCLDPEPTTISVSESLALLYISTLPLLESFPVSELPRCAVPGFPIRLAEDQYHGTVAAPTWLHMLTGLYHMLLAVQWRLTTAVFRHVSHCQDTLSLGSRRSDWMAIPDAGPKPTESPWNLRSFPPDVSEPTGLNWSASQAYYQMVWVYW
ncbi:hypothetical protein B0H14DRAFT_2616174 [Mycena olivaceomarginata]|nr:hypothetical protein B0H14DRAFT_2616174 [Mycena olivaceomarginata]